MDEIYDAANWEADDATAKEILTRGVEAGHITQEEADEMADDLHLT